MSNKTVSIKLVQQICWCMQWWHKFIVHTEAQNIGLRIGGPSLVESLLVLSLSNFVKLWLITRWNKLGRAKIIDFVEIEVVDL